MKKLLMSVLMAAALPASALAQAWPDKPVTVVVPFGAGGGVDAAARIVMPKLAERLGQQVVIDNVPGASGTIGTQRVAKAKADGTTLLFAVASPINVAPLVAPASVRYDALKDLAPIAPVAVSPFVLVGKLGLPAANTAELLALARKQPGKLTYGTDGFGTSLHVTAAMITATAGVDILHVPYKSGPQVLTDVAGGQVDLGVLPVALVQGSPPASRALASTGSALKACWCRRIASSITSNTLMPSTCDEVPVKYFSTSDFWRPMASKICAPV